MVYPLDEQLAVILQIASAAPLDWVLRWSVRSMTPTQDSPKSVSFTCPLALISRLSGFRSRWMMPCVQTYEVKIVLRSSVDGGEARLWEH